QIKSTDDSDNKYTDIKTGQAFSGTLKTNFWGTTQITISLQAKNLKNDTVNGILEYSY
ncbi:MAG: hypothetical protein H6Q74_2046, partial [Firmicutes bacterium]|nr:hypothetical protein [Bacillota bacterium]